MGWKEILLVVLLLVVGYALGNLLPLFPNKTDSRVVYFPYMYKNTETYFHDSIIVHEINKTYIKKEYEKDSIYISSLPDSLLWNAILSRARELLEQ